MNRKLLALMILAFFNAFILEELESMKFNSDLFIYGKVTTVDGQTYSGQIRWGKEEAFWFDHFNSSKPTNEYLNFLTDDELDQLEENNRPRKRWFEGVHLWSNTYYSDNTHVFACQFGDIQQIKPLRGDKLRVTTWNGIEWQLDGGSNDVGTSINIYETEIGTVKVAWDEVELVEFYKETQNQDSAYGLPLYGMVETTNGDFTGYLQWDHDERLTEDELDGETNYGDFSIKFGNIQSITRRRSGCNVILKSGRELYMTGSNDVDDGNRGVIINIPDMGRVDVPWDEFLKMTLTEEPSFNEASFKANSEPIIGSVSTENGHSISGSLVFDLDESAKCEFLNGKSGEIEYFIPFRNVEKIEPRNNDNTLVKLRNGEAILLSDKVDVNYKNDGVLVFVESDNPTYIPWSDISRVTIN